MSWNSCTRRFTTVTGAPHVVMGLGGGNRWARVRPPTRGTSSRRASDSRGVESEDGLFLLFGGDAFWRSLFLFVGLKLWYRVRVCCSSLETATVRYEENDLPECEIVSSEKAKRSTFFLRRTTLVFYSYENTQKRTAQEHRSQEDHRSNSLTAPYLRSWAARECTWKPGET